MDIIVSGTNISLGVSLKTHIEELLIAKIKRYFDHAVSAHVVISRRHGATFVTEIVVNDGTGRGTIIRGDGEDYDAYHSADLAVARVEKQLRRYNKKLKNWHKKRGLKENFAAIKRILPMPEHYELDTVDSYEEAAQENNFIAPEVVSEAPITVGTMAVSDAIMKLELLNTEAILFINEETACVNLVYKKGVSIAWVETTLKAS